MSDLQIKKGNSAKAHQLKLGGNMKKSIIEEIKNRLRTLLRGNAIAYRNLTLGSSLFKLIRRIKT